MVVVLGLEAVHFAWKWRKTVHKKKRRGRRYGRPIYCYKGPKKNSKGEIMETKEQKFVREWIEASLPEYCRAVQNMKAIWTPAEYPLLLCNESWNRIEKKRRLSIVKEEEIQLEDVLLVCEKSWCQMEEEEKVRNMLKDMKEHSWKLLSCSFPIYRISTPRFGCRRKSYAEVVKG
eukprot:snap_masked-scaffold_8-processed-gene-4.41-mRNA-1 protein AED:1.00 eAED:1.00 QI:0/-1/0/0/-1/1/1/0/174